MSNHHLNKITDLLWAFIEADSWSESREIVEREHELLFSPEADVAFERLLKQHRNDPKMMSQLQDHQTLLKACQVEGIETAFAKKTAELSPLNLPPELMSRLLAISSEEEMEKLKQAHPEVRAALNSLADVAQQALAELMAESLMQLPRMTEPQPVMMTAEKRQELSNKLKIFISKETLQDCHAYLEQHPELVSKEGLAVMELLIKRALQTNDREVIELFMERRDMLLDVFNEQSDTGLDDFFFDKDFVSIWELLEELMDCEEKEDVIDLVDEYPELLSDHVDMIIEQTIAHSLVDGHISNIHWINDLQINHAILRELRQKEQDREE